MELMRKVIPTCYEKEVKRGDDVCDVRDVRASLLMSM